MKMKFSTICENKGYCETVDIYPCRRLSISHEALRSSSVNRHRLTHPFTPTGSMASESMAIGNISHIQHATVIRYLGCEERPQYIHQGRSRHCEHECRSNGERICYDMGFENATHVDQSSVYVCVMTIDPTRTRIRSCIR